MLPEQAERFGTDGRLFHAQISPMPVQEVPYQCRDVIGSFLQRRQGQGNNVNTVEQVFAKFLLGNRLDSAPVKAPRLVASMAASVVPWAVIRMTGSRE